MQIRHCLYCFILVLFTAAGCGSRGRAPALVAYKPPAYPVAPRGDAVDVFHGTSVPDVYRALEVPDAPQTRAWVDAESELTATFLATPAREKFKDELTRIWNYPKYTEPHREGDRYFFEKNDGLQNQNVLYRIDSLTDTPKLVMDPNVLSLDGTVALGTQVWSDDGKLLAYGISKSGSDRQEIRVRDIDSGKDLPDVVKWSKFTTIGWKHDNSGFFYNRFPEPGTVPPDDENSFGKIYWHRLGTAQEKDELVLERPDDKTLQPYPYVSDDGKYLVATIYKGTAPENRVWVRPVDGSNKFVKVLDLADASYAFIDNVGTTLYFQTNLDAPRGKLIAIDLDHPEKENWKTVIPEGPDAIASVTTVNNQFAISFLHDAYNVLKVFNLDGSFDRDLPVQRYGSIFLGSNRRKYTELFFGYSSFATPATLFRYDFKTQKLQTYHKSEFKGDLSGYETTQVFVPSKDGTKVPLFLTHRKGMKLNGDNPVLLYAYGGFDVNTTPYFDLPQSLWLERGGVYAMAIIRGGGEYGEAWHQAGSMTHKQNSFDDFEACAKWLVDQKYTRPERLAIDGASNGGLLTAACMLQTPELFGAVVSEVPVTDMLRFKKFAAGAAWLPEYGDAEESVEIFKTLFAYSPLHNVKPGVVYPPVMVLTADTDDRVDPSHAKKFVATLQAAQEFTAPGVARNPILLRVDTKAGHGGGKPTAKVIEEFSDVYGFLLKVLGME